VVDADVILHVTDAGSTDWPRHVAAVNRVLEEVGAAGVAVISVFNKIDALGREERRRLRESYPEAVQISAATGDGVADLLRSLASRLALDTRRVTMSFDSDSDLDRRQIRRLYRVGRVVSHVANDGREVIEADVPRRFIDRLATLEPEDDARG